MEVRAWRSGKFLNPTTVYGVWIGKQNRTKYFQEQWENIFVEIDGVERSFRLTPGFRRRCTEFRDAGGTAIRDWIERHYTINWAHGQPPRFLLLPIGADRFRLSEL